MKKPEMPIHAYNAEQLEAHQQAVDKYRKYLFDQLPAEAKEKMEAIEKIANELNAVGVPYYLYTIAPNPEEYACLQYNNIPSFVDEDIISWLGQQFLIGKVMSVGTSMGAYADIKNPVDRFAAYVNAALEKNYNPTKETKEENEHGIAAMNKVFGMNLTQEK